MKYKTAHRAVHGGRASYITNNNAEIVDFSASINPFPPELDLHIPSDAFLRYPDDDYTFLKQVIARHHGCLPENITVGNGSVEVIRTLCHTVLEPGKRYSVSPHTFAEYDLSARLAGAELSDEDMADVIFLCNPDNPSGKLMSRNNILEKYSEDKNNSKIVCVDEAFIDLADPDQSVHDNYNNGFFILRSLTKSFAIPGIRFGYGIGNSKLIASMEVMRPPWTVNALAESVVLSAFSKYIELAQSRILIQKEKQILLKAILNYGWICIPGSANYLLIDTRSDARIITDLFLKEGILVRDCTSFGFPTSIRIAIRTPEENLHFIRALESVSRCMHSF